MTTKAQQSNSPDMSPAALLSLLNDYHLLSFDTIDSTNEEAKRIAGAGGTHGAVIWAKEQEDGKGRAGRHWVSDAGNLFVTMLLQPGCDIEIIPQLTHVAAVAVKDTIAAILPDDADLTLKWPNDVLMEDQKIAGILLESFGGNKVSERWVAVGVGINVDSSPNDMAFPATSLKEQGVEIISAKIVLSRFIHHFIETYNGWSKTGFAHIKKQWMNDAWGLDSEVKVSLPSEEIHGIFKGIDKDGACVVQVSPKKKLSLHAGDVTFMTE